MIENLLAYGIWVAIVLIIVGFVALVKGADWLVDGASAIAKRFGISDLIIGLTVVAFGTSMPEFVVNMMSVAHGTTDLAITNILGSNIINTFVILGMTALVYPIAMSASTPIPRSIKAVITLPLHDLTFPLSIVGGIFVFAAVTINSPLGEAGKSISALSGAILLFVFVLFLIQTFRHAKAHPETPSEEIKPMPTWKAVCMIVLGLIGLVIGGELIVDSAVDMATRLGVSESIIGLTIVALGTSLPELATSVMAAFKKNSDIALGNVIGSNIFNIFFVLGASALIRPLPAYNGITIDAWMATLGSIIVWFALQFNKEHKLSRFTGGLLLAVYIFYLTFRLIHPY